MVELNHSTMIPWFTLPWYHERFKLIIFRDIDLMSQTSPHAARYAPNGSKFTAIAFFDFNSMYLWAQKQNMPLTPGLRWVKSSNGNPREPFSKKILASGNSVEALQYLYYCQALLDNQGVEVNIEHQYFHGEKTIYGYKVDGYAKINDREIVWEYQGEFIYFNR